MQNLMTQPDEQSDLIKEHVSQVPVPIGTLAKALGLRVLKSTFPPKISGQIAPNAETPSGFEIKVNRYDSPERQRFTIAHEIAHFLLHQDRIGTGITDNVLYRSNLSDRLEAEANRLAADLLMPKEQIRAELASRGLTASEDAAEVLAEVFRVSLPAMRIRLGVK